MAVKYNEQQLEAINSNRDKILVLACAGAGKSTTLVSRAARLIKDGVNPRSILCLTFTNKAGAEMGEKFKRMFPKIAPVPEFKTFHAFCYSIIVKDMEIRTALGYTKIPGIASDSILKEARETATVQTGILLSDDIISGKTPCPPRDRIKLETWKKAYRKYLARLDLITFDIMSEEVSSLFVSKHPATDKYKNQYKHIMVDEFQDTDKTQFAFVSSFGAGTNWFLVGDALQNLYAFRGTNNKFIKMLSESPDWYKIRMDQNYRSTREICEFANKMSTYAKPAYRLELKGQRDGDPVVQKSGGITSYNEPVYYPHIQHVFHQLEDHKDGSTAILCRTNNEVRWVVNFLSTHGIACTNSKKQQVVIPLIKASGDVAYEIEYLASTLTKDNYNRYIRTFYGESIGINEFLDMFGNCNGITTTHNKIEKIREILNTSEDGVSKADLILSKFKLVGLTCTPENNTPECVISTLVQTIESFQESSLYVGTIHSVKGLEYDTVFVIGVDQGVWLLNSEDNLNLYYVAITRAKEHLYVYTS